MSSEMSPDDHKPAAPGKDEPQSSPSRKTRPQEPAVNCPRCDSPNTKFCYYNNYSLSQPRHFCKTCRRYWTKGGALRNVPIGGGCRRNKKLKPSPRLSGDSRDSSASSDIGGLKFFHGISPAMDFQFNFPLLQYSSPNLFQFGNLSNNSSAIPSNPSHNLDLSATNSNPLIGFNFPIKQGNTAPGFQEIGSLNLTTNLASIESLSFVNQDLHWKLQKQRLATVLVGDNHKLQSADSAVEKPQPITFQNLEISKPESFENTPRKDGGDGHLSTEWYFDSSYATVPETPATSSSNVNENTSSSWSGVQAWTVLSQYSSLP